MSRTSGRAAADPRRRVGRTSAVDSAASAASRSAAVALAGNRSTGKAGAWLLTTTSVCPIRRVPTRRPDNVTRGKARNEPSTGASARSISTSLCTDPGLGSKDRLVVQSTLGPQGSPTKLTLSATIAMRRAPSDRYRPCHTGYDGASTATSSDAVRSRPPVPVRRCACSRGVGRPPASRDTVSRLYTHWPSVLSRSCSSIPGSCTVVADRTDRSPAAPVVSTSPGAAVVTGAAPPAARRERTRART